MQLKLVLVAIALFIALATVIYTHTLVDKLQKRERQIVELYASSLEYLADLNTTETDYTYLLEVIKKIDFPMILTDSHNNVSLDKTGGGIRNIEYDSTLSIKELEDFLTKKQKQLAEIRPPIPVMYADSILLNNIYYGDSELVTQLKYYPYFQILFALVFILIAYISFSYIKRNEQSNIWVGMAKETAHQLGTPISSLMGWAELLKLFPDNPTKVLETVSEVENDLTRLTKVANRFSKIGSKPELKEVNPEEVIERVITYFRKRLPQFGKSTIITITNTATSKCYINSELFEWVIENLVKNALDAIGTKEGKIEIVISESAKCIDIEVRDNGRGIDIKRRKDIFRPGYSTKRRGWGLGLSLSKRIIEEYHKGKIFVKHSEINIGATFQIVLYK